MNEYEYMQRRKHLTLGAIGFVAFCFVANSADSHDNTTIQDHYKKMLSTKNHIQLKSGYDQQTSGDKTGDAIKGAIIGGLLGNNIKGEQDGGAIGAVIGGMLGHANSNATGGTRTVCNVETRYNEERQTIYSHSTITFVYEGKQYDPKLQKVGTMLYLIGTIIITQSN